jgi:hypothetical protein
MANTSYGEKNEKSTRTYHSQAYIADKSTCNNQSGGYAARNHDIKDCDRGADIKEDSQ